ncbi:putative nucleotide-binding alpha-beta plait domain-containing protein [Medicago truncatula]|uniref:Putative nucleotide-binding alpha-beta plait domain-containing protein n=2 Tax=Medicago truncatula TaxID=3880 RepID=A0A396HB47_MEDTR|nr:putative nucleotide-binding alpha-beta plait domain-containing protein [Medicago truncatula]
MRTITGKSRQFAFIGFRTDREAQEAIRHLNNSYFDTQKITCEVAQKLGDANLPRPWSQHSTKKVNKVITPHVNNHARAKGHEDNSMEIDDPKLQDFLQVMQPRAMSKLWANDTSVVSNDGNNQATLNKETERTSVANHPILSDSQVDELPKNPKSDKKRELKHDGVISDMDYFKSKLTTEWSDSESSDDDNGDDNSDSASSDDDDKDKPSHTTEHEENRGNNPVERTPRSGAQELDLEDQENTVGKDVANDKSQVNATEEEGQLSNPEHKKGVSEPCRLFVLNLPYSTTEEELEEHFSQFGSVSQVHLLVHEVTKRSKGIAFIHFSVPEFAARALEESNNSIFQGRLLRVIPAKSNEENKDQGSKTHKQRREEERKAAEAKGDTRAWNSLFMRQDTITENVTRKHGVSKSDLLGPEADDVAANVALGETDVILETKNAFKKAGVNVESLEELAEGKVYGVKRSNHVLLAKNLPYGATENELAEMFGKFGSLDKIILPSTRTLALVIFLEPAEAKAAFGGLAYKKYRAAPLYLEWAPSDVLSPKSQSKNDEVNNGISEKDVKRVILEKDVEKISDVDIDPDRIEARSLFVKNLNFKTTDEGLREHFSKHMKEGRILSVKVKKHLKKGKNVSMGFGFVEFDSAETATSVCNDLQGAVLDSYAHILQPCHVKNVGKVQKKVEKDKSSTKLLVRNVAFEATKKDLRQLFSPFGQIKKLKLPMKFGNHRGFAFVEYVTQQEAQNALTALSSTHLYGRHLVIERAKEGESLKELRARTAAQFNEHSGFQDTNLSKKRKAISMLDEGNMKFKRFD